MNYTTWVSTITTLLEVQLGSNPASATPTTDQNFNAIIPACIDFVENRLQRELDLLNTIITDSSASTSANSRTFTYPVDLGTFIVVTQLSLIVSGVRQPPMTPVSREFMDFCYPAEAAPSTPSYPIYWCPANGTQALLGPAPDTIYPCEAVGTVRVAQMSSANPTNFLTIELPDLYIAASMVWLSDYQRNYGAASGDPQMALTWEQNYKTLFAGAEVENLRSKFRSVGSSARSPSPLASQPGN